MRNTPFMRLVGGTDGRRRRITTAEKKETAARIVAFLKARPGRTTAEIREQCGEYGHNLPAYMRQYAPGVKLLVQGRFRNARFAVVPTSEELAEAFDEWSQWLDTILCDSNRLLADPALANVKARFQEAIGAAHQIAEEYRDEAQEHAEEQEAATA